jgi:hypothetical protein
MENSLHPLITICLQVLIKRFGIVLWCERILHLLHYHRILAAVGMNYNLT